MLVGNMLNEKRIFVQINTCLTSLFIDSLCRQVDMRGWHLPLASHRSST